MTNYQMPVLTDSERKELAEYLTACVENRCVVKTIGDTLRLDRLRNQITLAALTAEPRGYIDLGTPEDEINILTQNKILKTDVALHTAPPVPALNVPHGWKLVPIEPTEDMVIYGFESAPDKFFSDPDEWAKYEAMSGCRQAAHRAKLCWAAMLAAVPTGPVPALRPIEIKFAPPASLAIDTAVELRDRDWLNAVRAAGYEVIAGNSLVISDGWIPCSDRMPGNSGAYLCFIEDEDEPELQCLVFEWLQPHRKFNAAGLKITHWMSLPAAPQQEKNRG